MFSFPIEIQQMQSRETENRPDVFVAVPSYNHAPFVEKCLSSIIAQTARPKKLLVIDDGSSDASVEIIERVLRDCPFDADIIARENRGLSATLNEAFEHSAGEFFAYLGSDDVWLPDFLAEQTRLLEERPDAVLAFSHAFVIDEQDRIIDSTDAWTQFADGDMRPLLLRGVIFSSPGVLYRRSALQKFRWNELSRLEDYEMYLKLSGVGQFARNPKVLCAWRRHGVNASDNLPELFSEMIAAQERVGSGFDISANQVEQARAEMKFAAASNFVRHGFRREGARLFMENMRGANSFSQMAGTALRLLIPESLFRWNRERKQEAAAHRFGSLDDVKKSYDRER